MTILTCARCGEQTAKMEKCNYCAKTLCNACIKSSKRIKKIRRLFICKDCWSKLGLRKKFKANI